MIQIQNLSKGYGEQLLLENISLQLNRGERLGMIGRNGHGKSTILRMILGQETADAGTINIPKNYRIGHLSQHLHFEHPTIHAEVCSALPEQEGGWKEEWKAESMMLGLGFLEADFQRAPAEFSGGFQIRLNLCKLLLAEPNLLLLDEPTNYLDITSVRWLEKFLRQWEDEMILITHDRTFMNLVTTHTAAVHRRRLRKVEGDTFKLMEQILEEEEQYTRTLENESQKRADLERFIAKFKAKASKARQAQSRVKQLEKMEPKDKLENIQTLDFSFREAPFPAKRMMTVEGVGFHYPEGDWLFKDIDFEVFIGDRIGIIGPNGKGKTTFLNVLAGEHPPVIGEVRTHDSARIGYFGQTNIQRLNPENKVWEEIAEALPEGEKGRARNLAGVMMFEYDAQLKKVKVLSGGERSRVMLGKILAQPSNLLLLDEPTHHLDMESIEALEDAIEAFEGAVLIVTHSEEILRAVCNRLVVFDNGTCTVFEGTYDDFLSQIGWAEEKDQY
jgi:ATP-binding cassette subfamily F protein 3